MLIYKNLPTVSGLKDLTNHLMIDLETIITIASMTYTVDLNAYGLHLGMKKSSTTSLMNANALHYTYDKDSIFFKSIFVYLY